MGLRGTSEPAGCTGRSDTSQGVCLGSASDGSASRVDERKCSAGKSGTTGLKDELPRNTLSERAVDTGVFTL